MTKNVTGCPRDVSHNTKTRTRRSKNVLRPPRDRNVENHIHPWNLKYVYRYVTSGVTMVGITRGGNSGCHPYFFLKKTADHFISHHRLPVLRCHPYLFSPEKTDDLFCSSVSLHSGATPLEGVTPHLFYLSDLVCPLFFVNLPSIFSFGCHPLEGVTRGGPSLP